MIKNKKNKLKKKKTLMIKYKKNKIKETLINNKK